MKQTQKRYINEEQIFSHKRVNAGLLQREINETSFLAQLKSFESRAKIHPFEHQQCIQAAYKCNVKNTQEFKQSSHLYKFLNPYYV